MPTGLKQPVGQKRLTNVAVVRLKKAGIVFEIACYRNKVSNWRAEIETDLDEVLQTTAVFNNVSKGIMAKEKQLEQAFGTRDEHKICLEILAKGELQVSDKERKLEYDNLYKDVASIIAEKCIDPTTNRQYTAAMVERALKDVHFNPDLKKNAKQQAFSEALPLLQNRFSIQRAKMRVKLNAPLEHKSSVKSMAESQKINIESTEVASSRLEKLTLELVQVDQSGGRISFVCLIDPGLYRSLHKGLEDCSQGTGRVELVNLVAIEEVPKSSQEPAAVENAEGPEENYKEKRTPSKKSANQVQRAGEEEIIYERGPIANLPEDFPRKEMFSEIDQLEPNWSVQLSKNSASGVVQATFFSPTGDKVGAFVKARRQAISSSKQSPNH